MTVVERVRRATRTVIAETSRRAIEHGLPPRLTGYRALPHVAADELDDVEIVHPRASAPPSVPVTGSDELSDDAGWWGFSQRGATGRSMDPTVMASIRDAIVVPARRTDKRNYTPAVVTPTGTAVTARELRYRSEHARRRREHRDVVHIERGTWILERVFDNHSHWLNAHLPKLVMLRDRDEQHDVLLPTVLPTAIEESIRRIGVDPTACRRFDLDAELHVEELRLVTTDRFRPELLRPTSTALGASGSGRRRIFVRRNEAQQRHLQQEDELVERLLPLGFEPMAMESLDFGQQMDTMNETAVLAGLHGAGMTNMIGCPTGATVFEILDPEYANPNFFAMASALGHRYGFVVADTTGPGDRGYRDLGIDPGRVVEALDEMLP